MHTLKKYEPILVFVGGLIALQLTSGTANTIVLVTWIILSVWVAKRYNENQEAEQKTYQEALGITTEPKKSTLGRKIRYFIAFLGLAMLYIIVFSLGLRLVIGDNPDPDQAQSLTMPLVAVYMVGLGIIAFLVNARYAKEDV